MTLHPSIHGKPPYIAFSHLARQEKIRHFVFTRKGGCSKGPFSSLNLSFGVGDDPADVAQNRARVCEAAGGSVATAFQVHGTSVFQVTRQTPDHAPGRPADALITDVPGRPLMVTVADCQPVLLADPEKKAVACVHSGWRGSVANVIGKTVAKMNRVFGTDPARLLAGVGPSLGPCCAEFVNYKEEIPPALWGFKVRDHHFDFWAMSRYQLEQAGVLPDHIQISRICTKCRTDLFFSYRGEKTTGRFGAVIGVLP